MHFDYARRRVQHTDKDDPGRSRIARLGCFLKGRHWPPRDLGLAWLMLPPDAKMKLGWGERITFKCINCGYTVSLRDWEHSRPAEL